jgi:KDO2-lipid IV(A) lauroyltransferase
VSVEREAVSVEREPASRERWFAPGDLPWAASRLARAGARRIVPLPVRRELVVLRGRLGARIAGIPDPVRANVEATLGGNPDFPDPERIARRYVEFAGCRSLVRTLPGSPGFDDPRRWRVEGRQHLDQALSGGRGAILATAHLGWWLLIAPILRVHGYPVVQTGGPYFEKQRRRRATRRDRAMTPGRAGSRLRRLLDARTHRAGEFLRPEDIAITLDVRPIFAALSRNRAVLIAGDGRRSLEFASFPVLGHAYPLPTGFMKIAMAARCPVLPVFGLEGARSGSIRIEIRAPLVVDPAAGAAANLAGFAQALDEQLRRTPHLWTRWETPDLFANRRAWAAGGYLAAAGGRTRESEAAAPPATPAPSEAGKVDGSRSK